MTMLNPRCRMISIRLSEEEFAILKRHCSATGARSFSEMARTLLKGSNGDGTLELRIGEVQAQMMSLDRKLERIEEAMARSILTEGPKRISNGAQDRIHASCKAEREPPVVEDSL